MPGRKTTKTNNDAKVPLPIYHGTLKHMDDKTIALDMEDHRVLDFTRNGKTKFFKEEKRDEEIKAPKFAVGDKLSIEGPADEHGFLTAVNVYWEGTPEKPTATMSAGPAPQSRPVPVGQVGATDAWKDDPKTAPAVVTVGATETAPPAAAPDPDDPGRPKLTRGKPALRPDTPLPAGVREPGPTEVISTTRVISDDGTGAPAVLPTTASPAASPAEMDRALRRNPLDAYLEKAVAASTGFTEGLPDYYCQEIVTRYQSLSKPANWQALDSISMTVVLEKGVEAYRDFKINGKVPKDDKYKTDGAWSSGEFSTEMTSLLAPGTDTQFRYRGQERMAGMDARVYDYSVVRERSGWTISMGGQSYRPAYRGAVWIVPATGRVLRIEMQAKDFPEDFPTDHVESAMDYENVRLGDLKQYLLPVHAENISCQRGSSFCSHNVIDFRNYHKYAGESSISFGNIKN